MTCAGCESDAEYRVENEWVEDGEELCGTCLQNVVTNYVKSFRYTRDAPDETEVRLFRLDAEVGGGD